MKERYIHHVELKLQAIEKPYLKRDKLNVGKVNVCQEILQLLQSARKDPQVSELYPKGKDLASR